MQHRYRITYSIPGDTWCRYFKSYKRAINFMSLKKAYGYNAYLTAVPEL